MTLPEYIKFLEEEIKEAETNPEHIGNRAIEVSLRTMRMIHGHLVIINDVEPLYKLRDKLAKESNEDIHVDSLLVKEPNLPTIEIDVKWFD